MSETAKELRALAAELMLCVTESPVNSVAYPIVVIAADHLCAIARIRELNFEMNK